MKKFIFTTAILASSVIILYKSLNNEFLIDKCLSNLDTISARNLATKILDIAMIPDGDIAVPSNIVHSKRYIISKWQRAAIGSSVIIFGINPKGKLSIALGLQKGVLSNPQGFMEVPLPQEDLSGLKKQQASRLNSKSNQIVPEDLTIENNAIREVYEEVGLKIAKEDLILLRIINQFTNNPVTLSIEYMVKLDDTPTILTNDDEFGTEDLQHPVWIELSDIEYKVDENKFISKKYNKLINNQTIDGINLGLKQMGLPTLSY